MIGWINKKKNQKGFTLIELIVVIAILGILAALAVPRLTGASKNAEKSAHNGNVRTLEGAASMAIATEGIPTADITWTKAASATTVTSYKWEDYIQKFPNKVGTRSEYSVKIAKDTGAVTVTPEAE